MSLPTLPTKVKVVFLLRLLDYNAPSSCLRPQGPALFECTDILTDFVFRAALTNLELK